MPEPRPATMKSHALHPPRSRRALRRCAVAVLLAWLNLLVQPCLAAMRPAAGAMDHCPHALAAGADQPCHAMQVADCAAPEAAAFDAPAAVPPPALRPALFEAPLSGRRSGPADGAAPRGTGPPLHIRYCSLSN